MALICHTSPLVRFAAGRKHDPRDTRVPVNPGCMWYMTSRARIISRTSAHGTALADLRHAEARYTRRTSSGESKLATPDFQQGRQAHAKLACAQVSDMAHLQAIEGNGVCQLLQHAKTSKQAARVRHCHMLPVEAA